MFHVFADLHPTENNMNEAETEKTTRSQQKRERILEVAGEMFIQHGFNAVTMDAIAEAAPVSKPTLYNHFSDKTALFFAVMEGRSLSIFKRLQGLITKDGTPEQTLQEMGEGFLDLILRPESISLFRIMIGEGTKFPELGKLFYEAGPKKILGLLADYLEGLDKKGILIVPNPLLSANFFLNMIKGYPHMQCMMGLKQKFPPSERTEIVTYAVSVFMNGHKKK
jgi:TetR/AcrR family transcriptional repressor of mexJK operon